MKKKKLIFILDNFLIGGSVKILLDMLNNFDRDNFELNIVTIYGSGPMEPDFRKSDIPIFLAGPKKYPNSFFKKIIWILTIPIIILRLKVFFKKSKPDIVITSLYSSDIMGIFTAWLSGVQKRIIIYHDVHEMSVIREFIRRVFAINLANRIIAVSVSVKDFLISHWKIPNNKVAVVYNGIDFEKFGTGKKPLGPNLVVGFIGRLVEEKDPMCFLRSLVILKNLYKLEPRVIIVGKGELELKLKEFINFNKLNNVDLVGWADDVAEWLKKIDILIVSSREEGLPLVALEGLAANKLIIASDIKPMKELIFSGDNGILFKAGDSEALAKELKNLLINEKLAKNYYNKVEQWIYRNRKFFDIKEVAQRYSEIFNTVS